MISSLFQCDFASSGLRPDLRGFARCRGVACQVERSDEKNVARQRVEWRPQTSGRPQPPGCQPLTRRVPERRRTV